MLDVECGAPIEAARMIEPEYVAQAWDLREVQIVSLELDTDYGRRDAGDSEYSQSYGRWRELKRGEIAPRMWILSEHMGYSDYSGNLIDKANMKAILTLMPSWATQGEHYIEVVGGHGTRALLIAVECLASETVLEAMQGLDDYPLIDEGEHSNMESEAEWEQWCGTYRRDFERSLCASFLSLADEALACRAITQYEYMLMYVVYDNDIPEVALDAMFEACMQEGTINWSNENGDSMYIDVDELCDACLNRAKREYFKGQFVRLRKFYDREYYRDAQQLARNWFCALPGMSEIAVRVMEQA
jgi:hypothetical protein